MNQHLLLLHGALGSEAQLHLLAKAATDSLGGLLTTHTLNFEGHGGLPIPKRFEIECFAQNVIAYIHQNNLHHAPIALFGYSMGGYVALYLARHYPQYTAKIITLGTKLAWNPQIAEREVQMLDPQAILAKLPNFAAQLQQRHAPNDWQIVLERTQQLLTDLGHSPALSDADWPQIQCPVCLGVGDHDNMVSIQETIAVYKHLSKASCWVLPNTKHPLEALDLRRWSAEITLFLDKKQ